MHIRDVIDDGIRCLLIGDVEPHAFNPADGSKHVHVGLMIDNLGLRVVPIITMIVATPGKDRDALTRSAIHDYLARSHGLMPFFGPLPAYAIVEPSQTGHIVVPLDEEGNPRGPAREIKWLGAVTVTPL